MHKIGRMNETIATQLDHRSYRQFADEPVSQQMMDTLFDVAMRTSTSRGLQHAALIHVKDQKVKDGLAEIGKQPYIAKAPEIVVGIVDARRSVRLLEEAGEEIDGATCPDVFREGFTDAVLMIQNMTVAAESLGLGVTLLGSVVNDYARVTELLQLPKYTFPVLGMMFGHKGQDPQLKPRMPKPLRVMRDRYEEPDSWHEALGEYDDEMRTYYDLRNSNRRVDAYTGQVKRVLTQVREPNFVEHARKQGFTL